MLENGFIKLHRSLLKWEWYDDINTKILFIHLLLTVNYYDEEWHGVTIKRGSRVTSYAKLGKEIGISFQSIRTAIKRLISTGEITKESNSEYTVITVKNYDKYQDVTSVLTSDQQTANKQLTNDQQLSKKAKKAKKEKEIEPPAPAFSPVGHMTPEERAAYIASLKE